MAAVCTRVSSWLDRQAANLRCGYIDVAFDSSYPTGGEAYDITEFAAGISLYELSPVGGGDATYEYVWDADNAKIIVVVRATGAEVANTTDLSGITAQRFYYAGA